MIIYEVNFVCTKDFTDGSQFFSNMVKAKSFVSQNKKNITKIDIKKHVVHNSKSEVIAWLQRTFSC